MDNTYFYNKGLGFQFNYTFPMRKSIKNPIFSLKPIVSSIIGLIRSGMGIPRLVLSIHHIFLKLRRPKCM